MRFIQLVNHEPPKPEEVVKPEEPKRRPGRPATGKRERFAGTAWRAALLRADMEAARIRPQVLAEALEVSPQAVSNWRRDGAISAQYLPKLARFLSQPLDRYMTPPSADTTVDPKFVSEFAEQVRHYRMLSIRPLIHAASPVGPAARAARAAIEGKRPLLSSIRTDLSPNSFAVDIPEGVVGPTGTTTGGCVVVDPDKKPGNYEVVLVDTRTHGPRLRRYIEVEDRQLLMPLVAGRSAGYGYDFHDEEVKMLGVCCEWHPTPAILGPSDRMNFMPFDPDRPDNKP